LGIQFLRSANTAHAGGAPADFAYSCHSLGNRTLLVSRLGREELGLKAFEQIKALSHIPVTNSLSGI